MDLAAAQFTEQIAVYLNRGDGTFGAARIFPVAEFPGMVVASDLSGDGDLDLATSNNGGDDVSTFAPESTSVLLNKGNGKFGSLTNYPGEEIYNCLSERALSAADINGDGDMDLVVSNVIGNNAGVYFGKGDGTLEPKQVRYGLQNVLRT